MVYANAPFGGPELVLKYLARYTHRVAISNSRLLSATEQAVTFTWKDYRKGHRTQQMRLALCEFVRRFLLDALPKGFVRIRRFGLLANCRRETRLARCRALLEKKYTGVQVPEPSRNDATEEGAASGKTGLPRERLCRVCGQGRLHTVLVLHPLRDPWCRAPPAGQSA